MFNSKKSTPYEEVSPKEAKDRIAANPDLFILDVREPVEYQAGHIDRAVLIPLGQLSYRSSELPKDHPILCVCHSGSRSSFAASRLAAAGYQVINLRGGMSAWEWARLPVARGK